MNSQEASDLREELARAKQRIKELEIESQKQKDQILALKDSAESHEKTLQSLNTQIDTLTSQAIQDAPFKTIGEEVRLRFLENHRRKMNRNIGAVGKDRIKRGDRAAHRGRPVPDALLCLSGLITDHEVYQDLYGVSAEIVKECRDVPEVIEVAGFRGSLQSEGWMTGEFQANYQRLLGLARRYRLLGLARRYRLPVELSAAFRGDMTLQRLQGALQDEFDRVWAAKRS